MHGNVWEWCQDDGHGNYEGAPNDGNAWISGNSSNKVARGGSWINDPYKSRSACRGYLARDVRVDFIGLRVVCVVSKATSTLPSFPLRTQNSLCYAITTIII